MDVLSSTRHRSYEDLETEFASSRRSPADAGAIELIVRRPADDEREVLEEAQLDTVHGLVGDKWRADEMAHATDGEISLHAQITLMNARVTALVAGTRERWPLAGDQFYVDLDLSEANLPAGTRLSLGTAVVEISEKPHTGCSTFAERYGSDARRFVNAHRDLRLRGVNARVIEGGVVRVGDIVGKVAGR